MNLVSKRLWYFVFAAVAILICIVFLATEGLHRGVDFQAGTQLTTSFSQPLTRDALASEIASLGYPNAAVSASSEGYYYIQTQQLTPDQIDKLKSDLAAKFGPVQMNSETVPQNIASEAIRNAGIAVILAIIGMLIYIAFAFRKMPSPFKYAVCAIAGLAFDIVITLGVYAILGAALGWAIDLMFIAGILAVLGYSVNNTIIVFDRVRENSARGISSDIEEVTNASVVQTLGRSFNSSLTTLFTLLVLTLFVGTNIRNFAVVLIIGVISGIVSSTFISPELLVAWQKKDWGSFSSRTNMTAAKAKY